MTVRKLNHRALDRHVRHVRPIVVAACLAGLAGACAKEPSQPAAASPTLTAGTTPTETFRFAPPDGTRFVRRDQRTDELAVVGSPQRSVEEDELRWNVAIQRKGERYHVKQDLVHIMMTRDGAKLVDGDVKGGISAELVIDRDGKLVEVKGLEKTAANLRKLAAPGMEAAVEKTLTPKYLSEIVSRRYRVLFGETVGKQATSGASWTVTNPPGSLIASRTVSVERSEPCGSATCARMRVDCNVDPRVLADKAAALVEPGGGGSSKISMKNASYKMTGSMLVEPATMLSHGASLVEVGTVTLAGPDRKEVTVETKGKLEITYEYAPAPVAAL